MKFTVLLYSYGLLGEVVDGLIDLYLVVSSTSASFTSAKASFPSPGFTTVLKVSVPSVPVEPVGVKVGVPTNGLCIAVTVTFLPGTAKELFSVVGLVSVTSLEVHFWKGIGVSS